jgi:outer membrane receptor protein involved in Fe transport
VESYLDLTLSGGAATAIGNRDLNAEEITSFELGYQTRLVENKLQIKIDTFYNILDEIIEFRNANYLPPLPPDPPPFLFDYDNVGEAIAYGGEISLEYYFSDLLSGYFNYSYQELEARNDGIQFQLNEKGDSIDSSPQHKINAGIYAESENGLNGSIDISFVDDVTFGYFDPDFGFPAEEKLDDYTRVDARIGYKFQKCDVEASLIIQNAFDDSHREFPIGEYFQRQVMIQLTGRF